LSGGLSRELSVERSKNETFQDKQTWSVDSQIKVNGRSRTVALLRILEKEVNASLTMDSEVSARQGMFQVNVREKKTGRQIKCIRMKAKLLPEILTSELGFEKISEIAVRRKTKGSIRLNYGVKQFIDLKTEPLQLLGTTRSGIDTAQCQSVRPCLLTRHSAVETGELNNEELVSDVNQSDIVLSVME
jgi:hypothetical protein